MKRIIIFFSLLLLVNFSIISQNRNFEASVFAGCYGVHIEGQNEVIYNSTDGVVWGTLGYSAGLSVKRSFSKKFYWTFDLRYIRKGSIYDFTNIYGLPDHELIKFDYAELPVLIGYKVKLEKRHLYFELGAAISKLLNSEKLVSDYSFGQDISLFDQFKDYDYSFIVALKYSFNKKEKTFVAFRVERSFLSIHEKYKLYNFDYGVELSYCFN